jgi:Flp pilus assembly protein TadB
MAKTSKKRRRKHRGTPAGTIEARGRTSKPPADVKRRPQTASKSSTGQTARERRMARLDEPPTWRGSLNRAGFAAAILAIFITVVQKNIAAGLILGVFALVIYVPMSYYTDLALYRRRQRKKQAGG